MPPGGLFFFFDFFCACALPKPFWLNVLVFDLLLHPASVALFMARKGWQSMDVPSGWIQVLRGPRPKSVQWPVAKDRHQTGPQEGVSGRWRQSKSAKGASQVGLRSRINPDVAREIAEERSLRQNWRVRDSSESASEVLRVLIKWGSQSSAKVRRTQDLHAERSSNGSSELSAHQMGPHCEVYVIRVSFALVPLSPRSLLRLQLVLGYHGRWLQDLY